MGQISYASSPNTVAWRYTEIGVPGRMLRRVEPETTLVVRMVAIVGD